MKKSKFTESQITAAIKAYEAGKDVQQICRELKINAATFYNWKKKLLRHGCRAPAAVQRGSERECRTKAHVCRSEPGSYTTEKGYRKKTLRPCQKREIAGELVVEDKVSIVRACRIVDLDRSMFYYESVRDDNEVEAKLNSYVENKILCNRGCPEYYKRIRREGIGWNHKRVERVYRKMGLSRRRKKKRRIPNPEKRPLVRPDLKNETWSMDFVEDRLENGRKIRTLNIIDDYNRKAIAMEVSFSFLAERVIEVLSKCIEWRGKPKRIRSDNGTEFIANKTKSFFSNINIDHIPIQKGRPMQNGYVERFNRSYREGVLDAYILTTIHQAKEETAIWMEDYNNNHPHDSLDDQTPFECI